MKRLTLLVASIVALVATSCVQADVEDTLLLGGEELVTISLEGPTMGARAEEITIGKGLKATQLQYAIYDEDWNCLKVVTDETFDSGLKKELKLRLVKNKTYNFVFWAQAPNNSYYTVNLGAVGAQAVEPTISVAYGTDANDDYRDAFFGNLEHKVEGSAPVTVYLKRPFAQINFGTNDVEDAKAMGFDIANATTSFKVVAHDTLNLKSGLSSGDVTVERTFVANELPENKTLSTDAKGDYHWVAMNYILWPDAENLSLSTCEMTIEIAGQEPIVANVPNAPARRNWRTNLVGSLLTQESSIFVEIVPETVNDYNGVIEVRTAEQFNAAFADPEVDFIVLADDITLTTATSRAAALLTVSAGEALTIDLNNHKLIADAAQVFDAIGTLTVKNGMIDNPAGVVLAEGATNVTITEVTVKDTEGTIYYDEESVGHSVVLTWAEFTAALAANKPEIMLGADITFDKTYTLSKDVVIDLNGKTLVMGGSAVYFGIKATATLKNGNINGRVYALSGSTTLTDIAFGGTITYSSAAEGQLTIKAGDVYAKNCTFNSQTSGSQKPRPLSVEGRSSGTLKFENCSFKSNLNQNQVYVNPLSGTASLEFLNCNFNNKTPNIMFAAAAPLTILKMNGTTKLLSVTLEINRAKDAVTEADLAYLKEIIANNSMSSVRVFYAGGSSEYIR